MIFMFNVPSTIIVGAGESAEAGPRANKLKAKKALLVTDSFMMESGRAVNVDRAAFDQKVEKMANDALASGSPNNNPVAPTAEEIVDLHHKS